MTGADLLLNRGDLPVAVGDTGRNRPPRLFARPRTIRTDAQTTLKAEINEEAWETLRGNTSRRFDKPQSGRIAVKVINHREEKGTDAFF